MSRTRATDADRDSTLDHLEAAYASGQLASEEREDRVARALRARTVDQLNDLLADLQGAGITPRSAPTVRPEQPGSPVTPTPAPRPRPALVVLLAALLLVWGVWTLWPRSTSSGLPEVVAPQVKVPEPSVAWVPTPTSLAQFRTEFRAKFGNVRFYTLWINDDSLYVEVPPRGNKSRYEGWGWSGPGTWVLSREAQALSLPQELASMRAVDFTAMFDNLDVAIRTLGVEAAVYDGFRISRYEGVDRVWVTVTNSFEENASLVTTPQGTVLERNPHTDGS